MKTDDDDLFDNQESVTEHLARSIDELKPDPANARDKLRSLLAHAEPHVASMALNRVLGLNSHPSSSTKYARRRCRRSRN